MNIADIWRFQLRQGNSDNPREGACLMDAVSWFTTGMLGDEPDCTCPVIAAYCRAFNDALPDVERQFLLAYLPRLVGTVDKNAVKERATYLVERMADDFLPLVLELAGHVDAARQLMLLDISKSGVLEADLIRIQESIPNASCSDWHAELYLTDLWRAVVGLQCKRYSHASAYAATILNAASMLNLDISDYAPSAMMLALATDMLNGMLAIGRQAEPLDVEALRDAADSFTAARVPSLEVVTA